MALIPEAHVSTNNSSVVGRKWLSMTNGDVGRKFIFSMYSDKTVHFSGNLASATVTMRGSCLDNPDENTPTDWFVMNDAQGLPAQRTATGGFTLLESPLWISPTVGAGAGANVDVYLIGTEN